MKKIFFSGYAPVHFLCFYPIYKELKKADDIQLILSGGFRQKHTDGTVSFHPEGFYDPFEVDKADVVHTEEAANIDADVVVCSHLSDALFPRSTQKTVQIFHGVSFKNYAVREKVLRFDLLCMPGDYHVQKYRENNLIQPGGSQLFLTGFGKTDPLVNNSLDREALLRKNNLDPSKPVLLYAPTGDKNNSLETIGEEVIAQIHANTDYNLIIKPHDHPKNKINWFEKLAPYQNERVRIIRDLDVVPWLHAADLLISDASSVITEYSLLDRPIVLLNVPALFKKVIKRGGALDLDTYGHNLGPVIDDPTTIVEILRSQLQDSSQYSPLRQKMARHVFHDPGNAARRIASVVRYAAHGDPQLIQQVPQIVPA